MRAIIGKSKPYLELKRAPEDPRTSFNDFLSLCYAAGLRDGDTIAFIDWDAGHPLKLKRLEAGIALVNA